MNNVKPYFEYVLIKPLEKKVVIASSTAHLETFGKVIAIGDDVEHTKVGDYVAFEMWDVKDCTFEEKKLYTVRESMLIAQVPGEWLNDV